MRNFWISCAVLELALLVVVSATVPVTAAKRKQLEPEELTNFLLSPEYSQWLVGPIAQMASEAELHRYLTVQNDEEAAAFIEEFWNQRGGEAVFPSRGKKLIFDERAEEADRLFSEATHQGRRTDRGTVHVLYGPPEEIRYDSPARRDGQPIEVWRYPKGAPRGLNGEQPDRTYRFVKQGDRTVFYRGPLERRLPRGPVASPRG